MNVFADAFVYLNDPYNWTRPNGILDLLAQHMTISIVAVLAAMLVALPAGVALGTSGRGGGAIVVLSNVSRAVPTLALLTVFAVTPIGFGPKATTIALAVFAIPPILTNTFVGFREVDSDVKESARAMGMGTAQVIGHARRHGRRPGILGGDVALRLLDAPACGSDLDLVMADRTVHTDRVAHVFESG